MRRHPGSSQFAGIRPLSGPRAFPARGAAPEGAYCGGMGSAQFLHAASGQLAAAAGQPGSGWLRWFVLGGVALVAFLAWFCLRGYRGDSDNTDQK